MLVEPEGLERLTDIYRDFTHEPTDFDDIAFEKKINIAKETLASDVNRLASLFVVICEANRDFRDFTRADIRRAIRNVAACYQVYRTYIVVDRSEISDEDRLRLRQSIDDVQRRRPDVDNCLLEFIFDVLTLKITGDREAEFVARFQQFTSPVMAKGVEDTAFYDYNRLTSLNEVGGDPATKGLSVEGFHAYNLHMQGTFPRTMTTLSTHDTKRADDVRARLAVLSEMPARWAAKLKRWSRMNNPPAHGPFSRSEYGVFPVPDADWRMAHRRGPDERVHAEGHARGKAGDRVDGEQCGVRRGAERLHRRLVCERCFSAGPGAVLWHA